MFVYCTGMYQLLSDPNIKLDLALDGVNHVVVPRWVWWQGKTYRVREVGAVRSKRRGQVKLHVYSVNVGTLDLTIEVDSTSLAPRLIAVSDGLPN